MKIFPIITDEHPLRNRLIFYWIVLTGVSLLLVAYIDNLILLSVVAALFIATNLLLIVDDIVERCAEKIRGKQK